jgi:hypothetical protein
MLILAGLINISSGYYSVILFRDDFDGTSLDLGKWQCRDDRVSGITQFSGCPEVNNGVLTITHHTYNPNRPDQNCLSQEIYTIDLFEPNNALQFKARLRIRSPVGNGLVAGFYAYMDKPKSESDPTRFSDEIDLEFLTNQINNPYPASLGDRVYVAVYNDCHFCWTDYLHNWWENPTVPKFIKDDYHFLDLTQFNTFMIRRLGDRVDWFWDPCDGSEVILIYRTSNIMPDEAMALYFNFWGADQFWPIAWDENLQPVANPWDDVESFFDVDFAEVSYIFPSQRNEVRDLGYILNTDYNADCVVNFEDFASFADDWLECYDPVTTNCN